MPTLPAIRSPRTLHRAFTNRLTAPVETSGLRPIRVWAVQAVWLGLFSGWLEAGAVLSHRALVGTVTSESVRRNWYHVPLGLLTSLVVFGVATGVAALLAGRWSRRFWRDPLVSSLGWFVAVLSPLLAFEELHELSSIILAAALASTIGPRWVRHRAQLLRWTLGPLGVGSVVLAAWTLVAFDRPAHRGRAAVTRPGAPNIALLVLDTVRADHLSLFGYARPTTPILSTLAKGATRFDFARSAAPWTLPSHAAMFTGRWPHELSVDYDRPLDDSHPTLAEFLGRHGYDTGGFVGNTVYCNSWFGIDRGFHHYEDSAENRTLSAFEAVRSMALTRELMPLGVDLGLLATDGRFTPRKTAEQVNRDALAWLDARSDRNRPFFLFLNYIDAHGPYTVPEDFPRVFSTASRLDLIQANRQAHDIKRPDAERYAALDRLGIDAYDDAIRYLDAQIGRLVAELAQRGQRENTWIIVTADHGEHFGEHGLYIHGNSLFRPLVNVPLLIVPPVAEVGRQVATPVSLRNLPATVCDLVGLTQESPFPGPSLRHRQDEAAPPLSGGAVLSEWKIPHGTEGLDDLPPTDRTRTALVHDGQIYHRDPLGPEALYHAKDLEEVDNQAERPDSKPLLVRLRGWIADLLKP